jgi:hypothetical protein
LAGFWSKSALYNNANLNRVLAFCVLWPYYLKKYAEEKGGVEEKERWGLERGQNERK